MNNRIAALESSLEKTDIRWIYRKFAQLGIAIALIVMVVTMWHSATRNGANTFEEHAYLLVRHIVKQAEFSARTHLINNNPAALTDVTAHLANSDFIIDATIYSAQGELLAQSKNPLPLTTVLGLNAKKHSLSLKSHPPSEDAEVTNTQPKHEAFKTSNTQPLPSVELNLFPIIETINDETKNLGFIRVTFDYDRVQKHSKDFQEGYSDLTRLMLLISALIGVLLARAFAK